MKNIIDICTDNITDSLHSLYEASLLDEIEDTLTDGDALINEYNDACKDWKKLLNSKKFKKIIGSIYKLHIQSSSLAKYLCRGIKDIDVSDLEYVDIEFDIDDALWSEVHYIKINVASKYHIKVQARNIKYDDGKTSSDILPVKDAVKLISQNISKSEYLQDLDKVKDEFIKNITYKKK